MSPTVSCLDLFRLSIPSAHKLHLRSLAVDKKKDISGKEFKNISNGGQMLGKNALDGFRRKISESDDKRKGEAEHRSNNNSRFDRGMKSRNNFNRNYDDRNRRNINNRSFQPERNRFVQRNREQ